MYYDDVQMQMEAKAWADRFNDRFGRKVAYVDIFVPRTLHFNF